MGFFIFTDFILVVLYFFYFSPQASFHDVLVPTFRDMREKDFDLPHFVHKKINLGINEFFFKKGVS
jgi:hypothetical protein